MIKTNNKNRVPLLQYPAAARFLMKGEYAFLDTHSCSLRAAVRALGSETALQPTSVSQCTRSLGRTSPPKLVVQGRLFLYWFWFLFCCRHPTNACRLSWVK